MTQDIEIKSKSIKIGGISLNLHLIYIVLCFIIPWTIYLKTYCPTVTVGDNGELIAAPYVLGIPHPTGYPTFCIFGKMFTMIFPFGSAGIRMNLIPAVYSSIAIIFIYMLLFEIFKNMEIAVISSLLFSFTRIFWSQSISAEVYSLNILFYAAWLFYLVRWLKTKDIRNLYSFAFFCLMGFTNHLTTILAGPGLLYIGFIHFKKFFKLRNIIIITCLIILLFTTYWYLPMRSAVSKAEIMSSLLWGDQTRINDFKRHLSGSTFHGLMFTQSVGQVFNNFKTYLNILNWEFTSPFIVLLIIGLFYFYAKNRKFLIFTFLIFATDIFYSINYKIEDINVFYLPSFLMALIWIAAGFKYLLEKKIKWAVFLIPFLIITPFIISYFPNNLNENFISYDYGNSVVNSIERGSILLSAGWITPFIFSYLKLVEGKGNDVTMKVDDKGLKLNGLLNNPIYPDGIKPEKDPAIYTYIPFDIPEKPEFDAVPNGPCYIVRSDLKCDKGHLPLWWSSSLRSFDDPKVFKDFQTSSLVAMCYSLEGESYFQEGYPIEAMKYYDKAVQSAIDNKQLFNNLGSIYEKKGWYNKAKESYTIALILDPNFLPAKRNMATIYYKLGDYPRAMKLYNSITDSKFGDNKEVVFLTIGDMYYQNGQYIKALDEYKTAMTRFPGSKNAKKKVALAYSTLENYDKALETLKELLFMDPNDYQSHNGIGTIYQKLGLLKDARDEYKKAIDLDCIYTDAYVNLANTYAAENNWIEAEKILQDALKVANKSPDLFNALGSVSMNLKKTAIGLEYFKNSVKLDNNFEKGWINLSKTYKMLGDAENERLALNKIDELRKLQKLNKAMLNK